MKDFNEACNVLSPRVEHAIEMGIRLEKPMPSCGLLWEELKDGTPSIALVKQAKVEVNHLECYIRSLHDDNAPSAFEAIEHAADELAGIYYSLDGLALLISTPTELRQKPKPAIDPFEQMHDAMKAKRATDKDIAEAWLTSRSPTERSKLLEDGKDEAIKSLVRRCTNLRANRKKSAK